MFNRCPGFAPGFAHATFALWVASLSLVAARDSSFWGGRLVLFREAFPLAVAALLHCPHLES